MSLKIGGTAAALQAAQQNDGVIDEAESEQVIQAAVAETLEAIDPAVSARDGEAAVEARFGELRALIEGTSSFATPEMAAKTGERFEDAFAEAYFTKMFELGKLT